MNNPSSNNSDNKEIDKNQIWILEEASYRVKQGQPIVLLFSRNYCNNKETVTHEIHGFRPYFYAPINEKPDLPAGCEYSEEITKDALGRDVRKVYTDIPSTVRKVREQYSFTCMADYLFEKRWMADNKVFYAYQWVNNQAIPVEIEDVVKPRILYVDIEVLSPQGIFPEPIESKFPVVSIQMLDSYTNDITVLTAGNLYVDGKKYNIPQTDAEDHIACKSEEELFKVFQEYIKITDPDLITMWNGDKYDLPYLIRRASNLKISISGLGRLGRPMAIYEPGDDKFNLRIPGRSTLDMMSAFKVFYKKKAQRESYDLKTVSADYGFPYADYGYKLAEVLGNKDYVTFLQYCRNDVIALKNIDDKVGLFNFYETLRKIAGCKLDNTLHNSVIIESLLVKYDILPMPTKNRNLAPVSFEGALVLTPPCGIFENVGTVDLAALYPTVMRAFPGRCCPDAYMKVVEVLELVVDERERYRAINKTDESTDLTELIEYIYKVLANSFYGALGLQSFRLFKESCASSVCEIGRDVDRFVHSKLRSYGKSVLYSDTDSSFFSQLETVEEGLDIQEKLNKDLIEWGEQKGARVHFSLKFEKLYDRILFKKDTDHKKKYSWDDDVGKKKKYIGKLKWKEGKDAEYLRDHGEELNFMGLELVRSDNSKFTKQILREFFNIVLMDGDIDKASQYIRDSYQKAKTGQVDYRDISIPKDVRKVSKTDNPWKRGIENTKNTFNYIIPDGTKPRLIFVKDYPYEFCIDDEIDIGEWKEKIDWDTMLDKTVTKKLKTYAESAGISWDRFVHGQQTIDQWFK
ncbi:MAG: DNA polymerase domain-containing protein [Patescibacteria group bacterium]|jgi:DNA polymerase elongation subunit (family B)